jgi:hypothetical protein
MSSGEDEALQAANAGEAADEDIQNSTGAYYTAQEQELDLIDGALGAVETADSREAAVAALARATVGINALYASTLRAATVEVLPEDDLEGSYVVSPGRYLPHPRAEEMERRRNERVEKYLKVANDLVQKYRPDQYQLSIGFPLLISITLTWNIKQEQELSSDLRVTNLGSLLTAVASIASMEISTKVGIIICYGDALISADEYVQAAGRSPGLLRSVQRLDGCDRHQVLHGVGELPVECDQRVGVELGQCHVLGVKGVRPAEQDGCLPCDILEDAVAEQPSHIFELPLGLRPGHLPAAHCLIEE